MHIYILCTYYIYIMYILYIYTLCTYYIYISFTDNDGLYRCHVRGFHHHSKWLLFHTVDGSEIRLTTWYGKYPSICRVFLFQLVQDFFHQQYLNKTCGYIPTSQAGNRRPTFLSKTEPPSKNPKKVTLQKCWRLTKWRSNEKTTLSFLPNSNSFGGFSHSKGFFRPQMLLRHPPGNDHTSPPVWHPWVDYFPLP